MVRKKSCFCPRIPTKAADLVVASVDLDESDGFEPFVELESADNEESSEVTPLAAIAELAPWFPGATGDVSLPLTKFRDELFKYNEQIQIQLLGVLVAEQSYQAARGAFEPSLVSELDHLQTLRPNNAEQTASQSGIDVFDEKNTTLSNGVEQLLRTNGRVRVGLNVFDLRNNLQETNPNRRSPEYNTFFGLNFTQPLLKDSGRTASLAQLRLAARESEMAFQNYRSQMMATVAGAEAAYWGLYVASQEVTFAEESLRLARTISSDTEKAREAGRSTEADVMAARVAILERESTLALAKQQRFEAGSTLLAYFSSKPVRTDADLPRTATPPNPNRSGSSLETEHLCDTAFSSNPDYLRRAVQVEMEGLRVAYAKNQKRPSLDLKASYGLNGLGNELGTSVDDITGGDYPAWSVGLAMRVPLGGNVTGKANYTAAEARKAQALLGLKEVEIQLNVAMENAVRGMQTAKESFRASGAAVSLRGAILADERERLAAGRSNIRNVFEVEEEYERSKAAALRSLLGIQTAALQMELVTGTILASRGWEVSPEDLKERTEKALARASEMIPRSESTAAAKPVAVSKPKPKPTSKPKSDDAEPTTSSELREFRPLRALKERAASERPEQPSAAPGRRGFFKRNSERKDGGRAD